MNLLPRLLLVVAACLLDVFPAAGGAGGGVVVGEGGRALGGAEVWLAVRRAGEAVDVGDFEPALPLHVVAGDDGRFALELPEGGAVLAVTAAAANHPDAAGGRIAASDLPDAAAFLAGEAVLPLPAGRIVAGVVVDEKDRAVAGAEVFAGGHDEPWARRSARADDGGRFELRMRPDLWAGVAARAEGFGTAGVVPPAEGGPVRLVLPPAAPLAVRVVDAAGGPVDGATVIRRADGLTVAAEPAGGPGRYVFPHAAGEDELVWVSADGHIDAHAEVPPGGGEVAVALAPAGPRFELRARVIDAATGEPVERFTAFAGKQQAGFPPGIVLRNAPYPSAGGAAALRFRNEPRYPAVFVRVEADGYRAARSEPINVEAHLARRGAEPVEVVIELEQADPLRGTVVDADGRPAAGALVVLATDTVWGHIDAETTEARGEGNITARADAEGRFELPPNPEPFSVAALTDGGWAIADHGAFVNNREPTLTLGGWGRIVGKIFKDGEPDVGRIVQTQDGGTSAGDLTFWSETTVGADGTFALEHVRPSRTLGMIMGDGSNNEGYIEFRAEPAAGETVELVYGVGRPVVGKIALPEGMAAGGPVRYVASLVWPYERHWLPVDGAGVIDFDRLPPGDARVQIYVSAADGTLLAEGSEKFVVPEGEGTVGVGPFRPIAQSALRSGDAAPPIEGKTPGGEPIDLADFRGKYVVLDFWGTWCGFCVQELPGLIQAHDALAARGDVAFLGVNVDDKDPAAVERFLKEREVPWPSVFLGPREGTTVPEDYGVRGYPTHMLVGPDGRVLEPSLALADIVPAVKRHAAAAGQP